MLERIKAALATAEPGEMRRLRRRAELIRELLAAAAIAYPVVTGSGGRLLGSRSFVARNSLLRGVTP